MRDFKKYETWKLSHQLVLDIYDLTRELPHSERYQIVSQMQRAAYSIPSNFSEGCGRKSDKEFNRFIQISLGSAHELEYFVLLCFDLKMIKKEPYLNLIKDINLVKKKLYSLSQRLQSSRKQ